MDKNFRLVKTPNEMHVFRIEDPEVSVDLIERGYINGVYWYILGGWAMGTLLAQHESGEFHALDLSHYQEDSPLFTDEDTVFEDHVDEKYADLQEALDDDDGDIAYLAKTYSEIFKS